MGLRLLHLYILNTLHHSVFGRPGVLHVVHPGQHDLVVPLGPKPFKILHIRRFANYNWEVDGLWLWDKEEKKTKAITTNLRPF